MMMDPEQLEFEFDLPQAVLPRSDVVVRLSTFLEIRNRRQQIAERARLVEAIVRSVDHIRGSDVDAEAM
jgi:hypothetical protein